MKMLDLDPVGTIFGAKNMATGSGYGHFFLAFCSALISQGKNSIPLHIQLDRQEAVGINGFTGFPWRREVFGRFGKIEFRKFPN